MKATKKKAPKGVPTQTTCSGHAACQKGECHHTLPWWHSKKR